MKIVAEKGDDNILFIIFVKLNLFSKYLYNYKESFRHSIPYIKIMFC